MIKPFLVAILSLSLCSCSMNISRKIDPPKILKYERNIYLATKYTVKFILKNEDLSPEKLNQVKNYLFITQQIIVFNKDVIFDDLRSLIEKRITDPKVQMITEFILNSIEKHFTSYDLTFNEQDEAVRKVILSAFDGAISGVDELLDQREK